MQDFINIGEIKRKSVLKGFVNIGESENIEKAKSGVYADDAENQKLNRVGQHYGSKKQEDSKGGKSPAKKEDEAPEDSKPSLEDHAKVTDSEVLKKVVANEKSDPALVAAAKRELTARGEAHAHNTPEEKEDEINENFEFTRDFIKNNYIGNLGKNVKVNLDGKEVEGKITGAASDGEKGAVILNLKSSDKSRKLQISKDSDFKLEVLKGKEE